MAQLRIPAYLPLSDPTVGELVVLRAYEEGWAHRRVEKCQFLDETSLRLRLSFDVNVPDWAPPVGPAGERLIPLTFLAKRDLTDLDFTDDSGRALPMLTSAQSGKLAADALIAVATELRPRIGGVRRRLDQAVVDDLTTIASADYDAAKRTEDVLDALVNAAIPDTPTIADQQRRALWSDDAFNTLARKLASSYLVCATSQSPTGQRRVFHLSFRQDFEFSAPSLGHKAAAAFGFKPRRVEVELDDKVFAGSYHAEVQTPADIHVVQLQVVEAGAPLGPVTGRSNCLHVRVPDARATVERRILCDLRVRQRGWLRNSALVALAAVILLAAGYWFLDRLARPVPVKTTITTTCTGEITPSPTPKPIRPRPQPSLSRTAGPTSAPQLPAGITQKCSQVDAPAPSDQSGSAATVLLALLGVAASLLARPGENPLASKLLAGARFLTLAVTVTLFLASASLAVLRDGYHLHVAWKLYIVVTAICAGQLNFLAWRKPHGEPSSRR